MEYVFKDHLFDSRAVRFISTILDRTPIFRHIRAHYYGKGLDDIFVNLISRMSILPAQQKMFQLCLLVGNTTHACAKFPNMSYQMTIS